MLPLAAGSIADTYGIAAGLACYIAIAFLLFVLVFVEALRRDAMTTRGK